MRRAQVDVWSCAAGEGGASAPRPCPDRPCPHSAAAPPPHPLACPAVRPGLSMLLAQIWAWALFVMLKDQTYSDLFGVLTLGGILAGTGTVLNFIIMIMHPEIDEEANDK